MNHPTCVTCQAYGGGFCHRYPPHPDLRYPAMTDLSWCLEHRPIEPEITVRTYGWCDYCNAYQKWNKVNETWYCEICGRPSQPWKGVT
jgi:hypothetical protein